MGRSTPWKLLAMAAGQRKRNELEAGVSEPQYPSDDDVRRYLEKD